MAVGVDVLKIHGAEHPEIRDGEDGLEKRSGGPNFSKVVPEFRRQIPPEFFSRADRRNTRDARGKEQPEERRSNQHRYRDGGVAREGDTEETRDYGTENDHRVNGHLHQAVRSREVGFGEDLRQDAFLGGAQKRRVNAEQKYRCQHGGEVAEGRGHGGDRKQAGLHQLQGNDHAPFRITVGHLTRV